MNYCVVYYDMPGKKTQASPFFLKTQGKWCWFSEEISRALHKSRGEHFGKWCIRNKTSYFLAANSVYLQREELLLKRWWGISKFENLSAETDNTWMHVYWKFVKKQGCWVWSAKCRKQSCSNLSRSVSWWELSLLFAWFVLKQNPKWSKGEGCLLCTMPASHKKKIPHHLGILRFQLDVIR